MLKKMDTAPERPAGDRGPVYAETAARFAASSFSGKLDDRFVIAGEMIEGKGEDSYYAALSMHAAVGAVFDGCGGLGSRRYPSFSRHTGAFMASRAVCSALRDWFDQTQCREEDGSQDPGQLADALREEMRRSLDVCMQYRGETSRIMGSMVRDFPTTAAVVLVREPGQGPGDLLQVTCFWAGDSRVYLMDGKGLAQLTEDDLRGQDAMSNLRADAPLSNYVSAGADFTLHTRTIEVRGPFAVFAASDGCFGYVRTPFHFEEMVLSCLQDADTPADFEQALDRQIREYAGDDYTLAFMNFGYGSFAAFRRAFAARLAVVRENYIDPIEGEGGNRAPEYLDKLWKTYRVDYERFLGN